MRPRRGRHMRNGREIGGYWRRATSRLVVAAMGLGLVVGLPTTALANLHCDNTPYGQPNGYFCAWEDSQYGGTRIDHNRQDVPDLGSVVDEVADDVFSSASNARLTGRYCGWNNHLMGDT